MDNQLRTKTRRKFDQKETGELLHIWRKHDTNEWSPLDFDIIREILADRQIEFTPQVGNVNWYKIDPKGKWLSDLNMEDLERFRPDLEKYYELLNIALTNGERIKEGECHIDLGKIFIKMTFFMHAKEHFEHALAIFRDALDRNREANALSHLGEIHYRLQHKNAIDYYQQSLAIYQEIRNREGEATQLINIGTYFSLLTNQTEKALEYFHQALLIYRELGNRSKEAHVLHWLGLEFFKLDLFEKAIQSYEQVLLIAKDIDDQYKIASAYHFLGVICLRQSQLKGAIEYFKKARTIFHEIGNLGNEATALGNMGAAYFGLKQLDEAIECAQGEVEIFEQIGDFRLEDAKKALTYYKIIARKKRWKFWS